MLSTFLGLPRWAHGLIAAAALATGVLLWLHFHDKAVVKDHEAGVAQAVATQSAAAAQAGHDAADQTKSEVEKSNEKARKAAAGSDDPLRAGLDGLRQNQRPAKPGSR